MKHLCFMMTPLSINARNDYNHKRDPWFLPLLVVVLGLVASSLFVYPCPNFIQIWEFFASSKQKRTFECKLFFIYQNETCTEQIHDFSIQLDSYRHVGCRFLGRLHSFRSFTIGILFFVKSSILYQAQYICASISINDMNGEYARQHKMNTRLEKMEPLSSRLALIHFFHRSHLLCSRSSIFEPTSLIRFMIELPEFRKSSSCFCQWKE